MKNGMVTFSGKLKLLSEGEGGRKTPIQNGYKTDLCFNNESRIVAIEFNKGFLFPGDNSSVSLHVLLHDEGEIDALLESKAVSIADGPNTIGKIEIFDTLNRSGVKWE